MNNTIDIKQEITKQQEHFARGFDSYFKYFSDQEEVIEGIFKSHKIRFTQPHVFNDPLEFSPTMHFHDATNSYRAYNLNGSIFPSVELFFRVQVIESQINSYGILSLTKLLDSFDMWSQYANGHRGFIIEFKNDFNNHPLMKSQGGDLYPVKEVNYIEDYSINLENLVDADGMILKDDIHNELFFKKTSRWNYEHEYRMVRPLADCPDYKPPEMPYAYTDTNLYLFPFDWNIVSSITLGANMSIENRKQIVRFCEEHNIHVEQAHIIRNHKDRFGKPSTIYLLPVSIIVNKEAYLQAKPQLFCTDTIKLSHAYSQVQINNISDLPYYNGYEEVVNQFYLNLEANNHD